jgi:2-hydroxychromene-2-carboxylate isomerase
MVTVCAAVLMSCSKGDGAAAAPAKSANAVKVEFFVMSQCPYGVQVVNGVKDSLDKLGPDVDFHMDYIGQTAPDGALSSMHGPNEVTGDIVQLCAMKYAPAKTMDMVVCQNKNAREVATNWEACATTAGLPVATIKTCLEGPEGKTLLTESFKRSQTRGASGSPTMFIAGKPYNGRRGSMDFLRAICGEYGANKPASCQSIPEPPKVNVTLISDTRCTECNADRLVGMLQSKVGNAVITRLDYTTPEGRKAFEALPGFETLQLPLVLFDDTLKADADASGAFARFLKPLGTMQSLAVGGAWQPACMNEGGCALEQCKNTMACRKETPGTLDVFVMSQCPYGVQALNAMDEVLKNFKGTDLKFNVNYIANGSAKAGFQSLHGQGEVDEDIRELCVMKKYGKDAKYMDYVLCRNKSIRDGNWEPCATNGIDAKAIKACAESDEGKKLLEENLATANALGIGASPTWLANGKFKFSGIDAETIRKNLCAHNPTLKGCDKALSSNTNGTPQGGCAQ